MGEILSASYAVQAELGGRIAQLPLNLIAEPGENIVLLGNGIKRKFHFEVLCGLRKPDVGDVVLCGQSLNALAPPELAAFRRDTIGGVPAGGGLIAELPMIEQIILPMKLAGESTESIRARLKEMTDGRIPPHFLYNAPGEVPVRKAAIAALLRAMIRKPKIIVLNACYDELEELDADALWDVLETLRPPESTLVYLSSGPAPQSLHWTQNLRL